MLSRIDALADSLMRLNGYHDPTSLAYKNRNPGNLRAFSPKHTKDENGYRVFKSFSSGYDNLIQDLLIKCSGKSHAHLTPEDTLVNLVQCYGQPRLAADYIKKFLRRALGDENITMHQPLGWFVQESE